MLEYEIIDPRLLHLPHSRKDGADWYKLQRQTSQFGNRTTGMPYIEVTRGKDGLLLINNGVTRATRLAKLNPGMTIEVMVTEMIPSWNMSKLPTIGDTLP